MAVTIDSKHLAEHWTSDHEGHLDAIAGSQGRYQLYRVGAHVSVVHDDIATISRELRSKPISREKTAMLDWQPDARDDQDMEEVFHHLNQLGATMKLTNSRSKLFAFVECPNFIVKSNGQPASKFRQYSVKISLIRSDPSEAYGCYLITHTDLQGVIPGVERGTWSKWAYEPKIVWAPGRGGRYFLVWHLQLDFVDLLDKSRKRRRGRNPFHHPSEPKRKISGVRRREDRQRWVAEMKPYSGSRHSKVQFGEFKELQQAARAVDAAYFYYNKHNLLNFPDSTPQLLASKRVPAPPDEPQKLKFVKKQAKWLAARTSSCSASSSTSVASMALPELRSFSDITSSAVICGDDGGGETDDGISQPQPWMLGDPNYELQRMFVEFLKSSSPSCHMRLPSS